MEEFNEIFSTEIDHALNVDLKADWLEIASIRTKHTKNATSLLNIAHGPIGKVQIAQTPANTATIADAQSSSVSIAIAQPLN